MSAHNLRRLLSVNDLCEILNCKPSYIHQRTGQKAKREPRIPTVAGMRPLRFDPEVIESVFFMRKQEPSRSLKSKKIENSAALKVERTKERLW